MKKNYSNKSKAMLWILGAILSIVLMAAAHPLRSSYPNLVPFIVIACIFFAIVCVAQALKEFSLYKLNT